MPSQHDIVTITVKAGLHPDTGKYTAAEVASCALLSNLDSTANPPDTNKGVRATLQHDSPARPGSEQAPVVQPPYDTQMPLYRLTFAQNMSSDME